MNKGNSSTDSYGKNCNALPFFYPQIPGLEILPIYGDSTEDKPIEQKSSNENRRAYVIESKTSSVAHNEMYRDLMVNNYRAKQKPGRKKIKIESDELDSLNHFLMDPLANTNHDSSKVNSNKTFVCKSCGKDFKFQTSLLRHNNKVHNGKYRCPICKRVFSRQAYLDVHVSKPNTSCYRGAVVPV